MSIQPSSLNPFDPSAGKAALERPVENLEGWAEPLDSSSERVGLMSCMCSPSLAVLVETVGNTTDPSKCRFRIKYYLSVSF